MMEGDAILTVVTAPFFRNPKKLLEKSVYIFLSGLHTIQRHWEKCVIILGL